MKAEITEILKKEPILRAVFESAVAVNPVRPLVSYRVKAKAYLVGGVVRNLVLSRPPGFDYDIVLDGKVKEAAELLASKLKGSAFLLDKKLGSYRVTIKGKRDVFNIDISKYKGKDILEDLRNRDFTINAMALEINSLFKSRKADIIDIFGSRNDAKKKTIRMLNPDIFEEDPIRLLRAVRLSAQYGLNIDKDTERLIKAEAGLLSKSSWERIRDEFFSILACPESVHYINRLYELSLLCEIIPEIKEWEQMDGYDLVSHAIRTLEQGERLIAEMKTFAPEFAGDIDAHFQILFGNIKRSGLFKLALFIHDAGKPLTMKREDERIRFIGHETGGETISKRIARRLKISRKGVALIAMLVRNHHRVFNLAFLDKPTKRSKAHLFRAMAGENGLDLLLLSLADARATRGGEDHALAALVKDLIGFYYKVYSISKPKPVLNGEEAMKIFGVPQGILVGRILEKLSDAEGEGLIKNKKDAVRYIEKWLSENNSKGGVDPNA